MVIKGNSRSNGAFWSKHLMNDKDNERVAVVEMKGLYAEDVKEALREMRLVAAGTNAQKPYYIVSMNPREDERLTPEQWETAVDILEHNLKLDGHARFQVEHEKQGRTHRHIVWSRVDVDSMTVVPTTGNYEAHDKTRFELEQAFNHEPTPQTPEPSQRRSREFADWETWRGATTGIDPKEMKAEITQLWQHSDGGKAFQAAIEEKGYLLASGNRRDFVLIDPQGDIHSLGRRIDGIKAADIRAKMNDLDRDSLMNAKEASAWMKGKEEAETSGSSDARILPQEQQEAVTAPPVHNPKLTVLEYYATQQQELSHATAQDFTDQQQALIARHGWQYPSMGTQHIDEQLQLGYESMEAQHAAIPQAQVQPEKQPHESWAEFVARTTSHKDREPELER